MLLAPSLASVGGGAVQCYPVCHGARHCEVGQHGTGCDAGEEGLRRGGCWWRDGRGFLENLLQRAAFKGCAEVFRDKGVRWMEGVGTTTACSAALIAEKSFLEHTTIGRKRTCSGVGVGVNSAL